MSGHSKWSNIKRKKEANDKIRGNIFGKLSHLITLSVVEGGGNTDPDNNVKLRLAIEKAHASNMPKENIKRAIEKGVGPDKNQIKEIIYEGFGPYGVSLIILAATDNQNRTLSEIRNILEKHQGKLGNSGSVSYQFQKCGLIVFDESQVDQDKILMISDQLKAFDIIETEDRYYLYFPYEHLGHIKNFLKDVRYESAEVDFKPQTIMPFTDDEKIKKISELIDLLEASDDIQKVFTNL
ncbi:YebC/PmpR family DNA-binding transcriptional regulator [Candidatus Roizmanbacteria bacterium CG_4_10_14_0_2_um_filter_36_35]|uniref:Probable transcriptional regulatory protein COY13_04610 n=2 Tax=Candidatus Roizmaniibacteriota TaxID=1752723 RepID=A0A2M7U6J7_9BACT|nr:MAG: YebC/PmpR family DNA-binding transcriptional regulator [Candidatus Roizmanbacteria bacterium CG_4_10_14_0_2_um_filter_36_35]PJC33691.1 MAG: YebC/PmpR family DNA-binding transcriptional regulator [Candidatus Roizmanbacteria bacterium CG_4_9_14_0_2_um_filter_36_12]PJC79909.1 MAG: YebC/PmpR family DNA-binding transcriptional regulator [Candidatus Roizmanbacteria bacterium CG_4_8_14_3_um_filter_36_12]